MVQPKTPPLSIRPGSGRLERIDAYAKAMKLSRHLAILVLLDKGLEAANRIEVPTAPKIKLKVGDVVTTPTGPLTILSVGPRRAGYGERSKQTKSGKK